MTRTIDFDAFRAEQKQEPLELKLGGKTYELPTSMPAPLALEIIRLQGGGDGEMDIPPTEIARLGAALFGGVEQFETIMTDGRVTMDEMPELIKMVVMMYSGDRPNRAARRAGRAKTTSR